MAFRKPAFALLAAGAACLAACGTGQFVSERAPGEPLRSYGKVVVTPFSASVGESENAVERKQAELLAAQITRRVGLRLAEKGFFQSDGRTLSIRGEVVRLDPGSPFLRWLIGFGAGRGEIVARVTLSNEAEEVVARGDARGTVTAGFFGGSIDEAATRLADALVRFVEDHYEGPKTP